MRFQLWLKHKKHCYDKTHKHYFSVQELSKACAISGFKVLKKSTMPLELLTQGMLEKNKLRVPAFGLGSHIYILIQRR
jgi:hypothetical protein